MKKRLSDSLNTLLWKRFVKLLNFDKPPLILPGWRVCCQSSHRPLDASLREEPRKRRPG